MPCTRTLSGVAGLLLSLFVFVQFVSAQNTVSGQVMDAETNEPLIGVNILIMGTVKGTITDLDGNFEMSVSEELPYTLLFSLIGYSPHSIEITESNAVLNVQLDTKSYVADEVVVSASRVEERILESPVSVEKLDQLAIQASTSSDYYNEVTKLKGVSNTQASLTFNSINTRGFAAHANTRFVQLVDGMDNAAAVLNFPSGNIIGIGPLDIKDIELIPGTSSALYGPNAFNGILLMTSKSPFEYQGLSAHVKTGLTNSDVTDPEPNYGFDFRYANSTPDDKFAYKINFSFFDAEDWRAVDYSTDRNLLIEQIDNPSIDPQSHTEAPNFDGLNLYGDETQITVPFAPFKSLLVPVLTAQAVDMTGLPAEVIEPVISSGIDQIDPIVVTRTGLREQDLLESNEARSIKGDLALHYRLSPRWESSYQYKIGSGSAVYQGSDRFTLRRFIQQFHKLELNNPNFNLRAYIALEDGGDSYNLTALGAFANEAFSPTESEWLPTYLGTYAGTLILSAFQAGVPVSSLPQTALDNGHQAARAAADENIPEPGTPGFESVVEGVRTGLFQQGGASFIDDSNVKHAEATYDFTHALDNKLGVLVGANIREFDLFTDGTIFNEDPEGTGENERIKYQEWGAFVQLKKDFGGKLAFTGSLRYDKNELFEGQLTPRLALVFTAGENREHNIRASFQTGFRNPSTQDLFIFFPTTNILLGFSEENAARYGLHNGGAYTKDSYDRFLTSFLSGSPNPGLLEEIDLEFIKPEKLTAYEIGYKGLINRRLYIDLNYYYTRFRDFISAVDVVSKDRTFHKGMPLYGVNDLLQGETTTVAQFRPTVNVDQEFDSWGAGLGLSYDLGSGYRVQGNVTRASFNLDEDSPFNPGFNTPDWRINVGLANRNFYKNLGGAINFRWQDRFLWINAFGAGYIPEIKSLDAQLSYRIPSAKSTIKIGGTNLLGEDYRTNIGGPYIGSHYFISWTYDQFSN